MIFSKTYKLKTHSLPAPFQDIFYHKRKFYYYYL